MESIIAPGFLVAAPQLKDPFFEKTVVFMIEHQNNEGSLGLIINRLAPIDLEYVLGQMDIDVSDEVNLGDQPPLLFGGPVEPERGWVLHTPDWMGEDSRELATGLCVTASIDILKEIVSGRGPAKYRFLLGYSGWSAEQLVEEIKTGAWLTVPFGVDLVFDVPMEECWDAAVSRLGIDPRNLVMTVGDA